jgi:hypothetical protein
MPSGGTSAVTDPGFGRVGSLTPLAAAPAWRLLVSCKVALFRSSFEGKRGWSDTTRYATAGCRASPAGP